jgi:hypothetical protein
VGYCTRRWLPHFERAQVGRLAGEVLGDSRQHEPAIDGHRPGTQPEVQIARVVQLLHRRGVLRIQLRHLDEDVVVDEHAVAILAGGGAVLGEGREPARLERRGAARTGEVGSHRRRRRRPLECDRLTGIRPEAVVVR